MEKSYLSPQADPLLERGFFSLASYKLSTLGKDNYKITFQTGG
ncbi:hypothetical protein KIS4809_5483 [Bacillus sp. ZZV12-4809]|nr:hypothetical protein KIS4809_5483 [Bacillus sp. ZZV12-4809]